MSKTSRDIIYDYIYLCEDIGGTTAPAVARALGLKPKTVSARINELHKNGRLLVNAEPRKVGSHHLRVYRTAPDPCPTCGRSSDNDPPDVG